MSINVKNKQIMKIKIYFTTVDIQNIFSFLKQADTCSLLVNFKKNIITDTRVHLYLS